MLIFTVVDGRNGRKWDVYESQENHAGMYYVRYFEYFEKYEGKWRQIFEEWWDADTVEARLGWNPEEL